MKINFKVAGEIKNEVTAGVKKSGWLAVSESGTGQTEAAVGR